MGPNGRGAPVPRLVRGGQHSRAGATNHQKRFWREARLLMLFRRTPQGYSPPGIDRAGRQSGKCWLKEWTMSSRRLWLWLLGAFIATMGNDEYAGIRPAATADRTSSSSWATMSAGSTSAPIIRASCPARRRTSTSWPRGHAVHRLLRRGELHGGSRELHHRRIADPHGPDDGRPGRGRCRAFRRRPRRSPPP